MTSRFAKNLAQQKPRPPEISPTMG